MRSKAMEDMGVVHDTFVIERVYPATPERVFAAFADTQTKRRWFAESPNHDVEAFELDFRVGGLVMASYRFKPGGPFEGVVLANDGTYLDIAPARRIVEASTMTMGGRRISASLVTITLSPTADGTALTCTHQGAFFEGADGPRMREGGWRLLLDQLGRALAH
jgi:uncharacterized protein YndB with AHSA1/START domain